MGMGADVGDGASNGNSFKIFMAQAIFLGTGVLSTCLSQSLFYEGAADQWTMLLPFGNYLGMSLVALVPRRCAGESESDITRSEAKALKTLKDGDISSPGEADTSLKGGSIRCRQRENHAVSINSNSPKAKSPPQGCLRKWSLTRCVMAAIILDFSGSIFCTFGLTMAGSGVYQVVYSSVVCWSALLSRTLLHKYVSKGEWLGITIVTIGLALSALGQNLAPGKAHVIFIGVLNTLIGSACYAGTYVFGELMMHKTERPTPRILCIKIGSTCLFILSCYMALYTFPRRNLVLENISLRQGSMTSIIASFAWLVFSQLAHAITYFMLLGSVGAVSTGILQSLRAVCVFGFSSVLFCSVQESQCYTMKRGLATMFVVFGVLYYSVSKSKASAKLSLPMKVLKSPVNKPIKA